tara:strand:- start:30 stop:1814 length:1785 start_codon:yes stop_codon:yes gene_type:complete
MSTNGQLVFTDVDKITFKGVGNASNAVVDTLTGKIGVGVDSPDANLHVLGNSYVSTNLELGGTLIMGTVNVEAQHSLEAVTATGNITPLTVEFTNPTTSLVASGNVVVTGNVTADHFVGDGSNITGISSNLDQIVNIGNVTSNTVQFSNVTTGFVTTANVEVGGELTVSGNVVVDTNTLFVDSVNNRVGIGTTTPGYQLDLQNISSAQMRIKSNATSGDGDATLIIDSSQIGESDIDFMHDGVLNWRLRTGDASGTNFQIHDQNDACAFAIKQDGNVGIGESSPAELVHIRGTGPHMLIEGASNENGQIDFSSGPSYRNSRHQIESRHYALSGNGYRNWLAFRVNEGGESTPTTRMVIRGDGRVGIGTGHTNAVGTVDIDPGANRTFSGSQTGPGHTPPLYITGSIGAANNGVEFRHSNQSQGIGFGYNTVYATGGTGTSADQDLSLKAYNNGTVRLNGGTAISSDDRLKTNEEYITNATETLLKLKPQVYDKHKKINETCENPVREAGLITQDVYYDAPELRFLVHARNEGMDAIIPVNIPEEKPFVDEDPTKDPDYSGWGTDTASLNYEGFIPYLIKTIQELHERIDALENT